MIVFLLEFYPISLSIVFVGVLNKLLNRFLRGEFSRNVLTLISGAGASQVLSFIFVPIMTKVYSPSDFGVFASYNAILAIASVIVTMRYEFAISLPLEDSDAWNVFLVSCLTSTIYSVLFAIPIIFFNTQIALFLGAKHLSKWLYFLPIHTLLQGIYLSLIYWINRKKLFKGLAMVHVAQSLVTGTCQLAIGLLGGYGLIVGSFLGSLISSFMMFRWISSEQLLASVSLSGLKKAAKKYVKIPLLELPSALVESLSMQLPVVLIGRFFGSEIVGFFALAERVVRAPMTVIASSFSSVFRQAASEAYALTGDARTIFNKTLHRLAIFAIPPFIVLATTAPYLFSIVFGGKWRTSGSYAQIITPVLLLSFIATPLGTMLLIAGKQAYNLCMQIGLFVGIFLSIHIGYYAFGSVRYALCLLTIVYVTKHVFELYFSKRFCLKEGIDAVSGKRPS